MPDVNATYVGRSLLDSGLAAVVGMNADGRLCEFSAAAESMFGCRREDVLGRELAEVIIPQLLRRAHREGLRRYLDSGDSHLVGHRTELTALRADGTEFPAEVSITRVASLEPPMFIGFVRDITERRLAETRLAKSEALLDEAEELAGAGSFDRGLQSGQLQWTDGLYRVFGLPRTSSPPRLRDVFGIIHPEDRDRVGTSFGRLVSDRLPSLEERARIIRPDGVERVIELRGRVLFDDLGRADRLIGTVRDVTDDARARQTQELLSHVVESSGDAIFTKSRSGMITSWNQGAQALYGYSVAEAVGKPVSLIVPPDQMDAQVDLMRRVFAGEFVRQFDTERLRKDGSLVEVAVTLSPVRDAGGSIVSAAVVARDMTERRRYERRLEYLADHDPLTGLFNRRRFEAELTRELARAEHSGVGGAVVSVDLDTFKAVNDSAGHAAGDAVLCDVGHVLSARLRAEDVIARVGGDEFVVLLPAVGPDEARAASEQLLEALHRCSVDLDGIAFLLTASIGVALFEPSGASADELIVDADLAMYAAKAQGRDRIVVFDAAQARAARSGAQLSWAQRIRHALEHDQLVLHWQPIVNVVTHKTTHGELLLRMSSRDGLIPPGAFLQAAERLGLIHAIDRWVVRSAIGLLARGEAPATMPISANLSGESVAGDSELLGIIEAELSRHCVDPSQLIFEVTETAAITNMLEAQSFARGVRSLGCRLALDDFGTGFGSFYHLKHLPVDYLKIDSEFIRSLPDSDLDQRLVRAIVDIARGLGIETVAEAVGDDRTMLVLRDLQVNYGQGFHIGGPVPLALPGAVS